jgi:hypothetical protein
MSITKANAHQLSPPYKPIKDTSLHPARQQRDNDGGSTPHQYGLPEEARELQDLIEYRDMNFAIGNIFKACYRAGTCDHSSMARDMRKVVWFAKRELRRLEGE